MIKYIYISLLFILFVSCVKDDDKVIGETYVDVGETIPEFGNLDHTSGTASLPLSHIDFMSGKPGIIVFFVSSCNDCRKQLPKIQQIWEEYVKDGDFAMAVISRQEPLSTIEKNWYNMFTGDPFSMEFYIDTDRTIYSQFAASTVPRVYITNGEGVVTWMGVETFDETANDLLTIIRSSSSQ